MTNSAKRASGTQSMERTIEVLRELATFGPRGAKVSDLALRLGMEYPTVHRMIRCLVAQRMVEKLRDSLRYSLGPLVYELGLSVPPRMNLREQCESVTSHIAEQTGDTVFLNVRSGLDVLCVDRKMGTFPIKTLIFEIGNRRPLGIGAGGIALLMNLSNDELAHTVATIGERLRAFGFITPKNVLALVQRARALGYVFTEDVVIRGVSAISLPFGGHHGIPAAAISVASVPSRMPSSRHPELVDLLRTEIKALEKNMSVGQGILPIAA